MVGSNFFFPLFIFLGHIYHVAVINFWEAIQIIQTIMEFLQYPELVIDKYPYIGSLFYFYSYFYLTSLIKCWKNYSEGSMAYLTDDVKIRELFDYVLHIILIFHLILFIFVYPI